MMLLGGFSNALLLVAQPLPAQGDVPAQAAAGSQFAPPVGRPMTYRVTTRRIGRGYQLRSVMQRIDSATPRGCRSTMCGPSLPPPG